MSWVHPFVLPKNELKNSSFWRNISPTYQKAFVTISDSYLCFWLTPIFCISLNTLEDEKSRSGLLMLLFCLELTIMVVCNAFEKCSSPHSSSFAGWVQSTFTETINLLQMLSFLSSYTNYRQIHHPALVAGKTICLTFNDKSVLYTCPASRTKDCLFIC